MQCPRCLNTNEEFFYKGSRGYYCRKCISFGRMMLEESKQEPVSLMPIQEGSEEYVLRYPLTPEQASLSSQCARYSSETDVLLHCVCGAGKTELVVETIAKCLKEKKKVCFAIPRRQVVLELQKRLSLYFPLASVVAVCGGYTSVIDGDLIICTTHQLYRYYQAFDLLILDEPDAFPFKGNAVLHGIAKTSCRGHTIYLTATPDAFLKRELKKMNCVLLKLNHRPHGFPLPVPRIHTGPTWYLILRLLRWMTQEKENPRMIFVPTIPLAKQLGFFLSLFEPITICHSQMEERDKTIAKYRKQKNPCMVTTTIMERGVTIPNVSVCVFQAQHVVFDEASLIQIAGRVGRSFQYPTGDVCFLQSRKSEKVRLVKETIQEVNG